MDKIFKFIHQLEMNTPLLPKREKQIKDLKAEIKDLKAEIKDLKAEIKDLREEIKIKESKIDNLDKLDISRLYGLIKDLNQQIDRINQQIDRLNEQIILNQQKGVESPPKDQVWEYINHLVDYMRLDNVRSDNVHRSITFNNDNSRERNRNSYNRESSVDNLDNSNFCSFSFDFRKIWKVMEKNWVLDIGKDKSE